MPEVTCSGEPDAGNPHVRFYEGRGTSVPSYSTGSEPIAAGRASELQAQLEVDLARRYRSECGCHAGGDASHRNRGTDVRRRQCEVRMIQNVNRVHPELQAHSLVDREIFGDREIHIRNSVSAQDG